MNRYLVCVHFMILINSVDFRSRFFIMNFNISTAFFNSLGYFSKIRKIFSKFCTDLLFDNLFQSILFFNDIFYRTHQKMRPEVTFSKGQMV